MISKAITIYLIRHCEDQGSSKQIFDDLNLTINGQAQAQKIGDKLANAGLHRVYSSPMRRAQETAKIISDKANVKLIIDNELRDRNLGLANGMRYSQVQLKFSKLLSNSMYQMDFHFPDGESNIQVFERSSRFLITTLSQTHTSENIAIVSHPLILNYILYNLQYIGFQERLFYTFEVGFIAKLTKDMNDKSFHLEHFGSLN